MEKNQRTLQQQKKIKRVFIFATIALFFLFSSCSNKKANVSGNVIDTDDMFPVIDANIEIRNYAKTNEHPYGANYKTITAKDGSFEFCDIIPGKYSIEINKDGYYLTRSIVTAIEGESIETLIYMSKSE